MSDDGIEFKMRFYPVISPIVIVKNGPRTQLILRTGGDGGLLRTLPDGLNDDEINAAVRAWEAETASTTID